MNFEIKIKDKTVYSLEEFGKIMYLYPAESFVILTSNKFMKALYQLDKEKYDKIVELKKSCNNEEKFLFLAQYVFSPLMEIKHHRYIFKSLKELGEKILSFGPEVDIYLKDFLKYDLLQSYMEITGFDKLETQTYHQLLEIRSHFDENENRAYFKLGFMLAQSKILIYNHKPFSEPAAFFNFITRPYNIVDFANTMDKNQYVFAWLEVLGYKNALDRYYNLVDTITKQEVVLDDNRGKIQ